MAAQLYQIQGRYDLALAIYLRQQQPAVFDFIQEHQLLPVLHERVAQLLLIDEDRAIQLLMDQYDEVPASTVVPSIQVRFEPHPLPAAWFLLCLTWREVCFSMTVVAVTMIAYGGFLTFQLLLVLPTCLLTRTAEARWGGDKDGQHDRT